MTVVVEIAVVATVAMTAVVVTAVTTVAEESVTTTVVLPATRHPLPQQMTTRSL